MIGHWWLYERKWSRLLSQKGYQFTPIENIVWDSYFFLLFIYTGNFQASCENSHSHPKCQFPAKISIWPKLLLYKHRSLDRSLYSFNCNKTVKKFGGKIESFVIRFNLCHIYSIFSFFFFCSFFFFFFLVFTCVNN